MTRDVDLNPGQEVFAKVLSLDNWIQGGGQDAGGEYHRDTFYVWVIPARGRLTADRAEAPLWRWPADGSSAAALIPARRVSCKPNPS